MVDFRRWITALAVLAIFAGLASAQVQGGGGVGTLSCTASVAVPPQLRSEGMTELIGDIVLTCTGGQPQAQGAVIPTANITVSLQTNVTSRILGTGSVSGTGIVQSGSEALLLIDEPQSGLPSIIPGVGPAAAQNLCTNGLVGAGPGGCTEIVNNVPVGGGTIPTMQASGGGAPYNMFIGLVAGNQVTFNGIPILAPVTSGSTRVFRITNVRANVSGLGGGGLPGTQQLVAAVSISGSTSLPINNPVQIAGFVQSGLTVTFRNANNSGGLATAGSAFNQCGPGNTSGNPLGVASLIYNENFGTSFKTRVAPTASYNGQSGSPVQNTPGTIYNSESGFVFNASPAISGASATAGLADYGTRLKAVFNNIPSGVRIFVSTTNLAANTTSPTINTPPAGNSNSSYAVLINGEASPDANGFPPALSPTVTVGTTNLYEIPQSGGSATAVWEVINTNPAAVEQFIFGVWTQFTPNPGNNTPPPGTATVNAGFAPTPPIPFTAAAGSAASATLTIPRFADVSTARPLMVISICQTLLLFPFVTNANGLGLDTGIAIDNTSSDPIGTAAQNGTCSLTWYDGTGKTPAFTTPNIATGTVYTNLVSSLAPGFTGYMMALCNFQYAHGFAFISDIGLRNLAMGYLALVVNNGSVARTNAPAAESLAH